MWKTPVAEWMTTPAITADVHLSLADVQQLMERHRVHHLPIVRDGLLVGMIAQEDLHAVQPVEARLRPYEWRALLGAIVVADWIAGEPLEIGPRARLRDAAQLMVARDVSALTITTNRRPIGVITAGDLLRPLIFGVRGASVEDQGRERHICQRCGAISHTRADQMDPVSCWGCGEMIGGSIPFDAGSGVGGDTRIQRAGRRHSRTRAHAAEARLSRCGRL